MIHPFFKNKTSFAIYGLVWVIIALIHSAVLFYSTSIDIYDAVLDSLVYNSIYFLLGLALWYPTKFIDFEHSSFSTIFVNHALGASLTTAVWVGIGYVVLSTISDAAVYQIFLENSIIWRILIGLLFYTILISVNYLLIYYNNFREKLKHESELNTLVKEAELRSLKYQINPHFIFNSLNSISSLTISNPDKAREMTINLSTFLRGTLSKNEAQKIKLADELENVKLYLSIERVRFEGKFELIEELSDDCKMVEVPSMILQPLFENAIKHGVYESLDNVTLTLKCGKEKDYLRMTVINNYDKDATPRKGEGIGLKNIRNRLQLIYNRDNLLRVNKTETDFKVDVFIPFGELKMKNELRTIIIDDEKLARDVVKKYTSQIKEINVIEECGNGFDGIKAINELKPDLIFLDIQMPKLNGFEMLELIEEAPQIIFTTAFDQYALKAFDVNAIDYLLKPFSEDRFVEAVQKVLNTTPDKSEEKIDKLKSQLEDDVENIDRVVVKQNQKIKIIPIDKVNYLEAQDDYVMIHCTDGKFLKQKTMKYFEEHLDPKNFIRIHRSFIVNISQIKEIELFDKDSYRAILKDGSKLSVSRNGYAKLKEIFK